LLIACWKLAPALAAGNTVILKPSSLAPLTTLELARIIHEAGVPAGVVNVLNGSGSELGEPLCTDKRVDMISFTGSNETGKQILNDSSKSVKKLIMELGGKSASIVLSDANLEVAVNGSLCSAFLNQGQMCTAMSRIFVDEKIYDAFIRDFVKKTKQIKVGDGLDYETQMGPLISEEQRKMVISYAEKARKEGATLLCGGNIPDKAPLKSGFFFEPTVFSGVTPKMDIFKEEIFGPVTFVSKFATPEEAIRLANTSEFGLANCIWSSDTAKAQFRRYLGQYLRHVLQ
jgi:acyl-CoA reductase-like NAD-dependent aldehyde dehydrogenase